MKYPEIIHKYRKTSAPSRRDFAMGAILGLENGIDMSLSLYNEHGTYLLMGWDADGERVQEAFRRLTAAVDYILPLCCEACCGSALVHEVECENYDGPGDAYYEDLMQGLTGAQELQYQLEQARKLK